MFQQVNQFEQQVDIKPEWRYIEQHLVGIGITMIRPLTGNLKVAALCPANDKSVDTGNTQFLKYEEALAT